MLNNLDIVSAGCTTAASWFSAFKFPPKTSADVLTGVVPLEASEGSATAVVDRVDGRVADVDRTWFGVFTARASAPVLLLDATSGINAVATGSVEEVAAKAKVSGPAAIEGIIDVEDVGMGVEVWMSAGIEDISV